MTKEDEQKCICEVQFSYSYLNYSVHACILIMIIFHIDVFIII